MTYQQYLELIKKDENGCYVNLIIPKQGNLPTLNLIGKSPKEYTLDEVIRLKKYISELFDKVDKSTMK